VRPVKVFDDRFANPAYGLPLVTGLTMVRLGDVDLPRSSGFDVDRAYALLLGVQRPSSLVSHVIRDDPDPHGRSSV
jgi:hypothetical protein